MKTLIIKKDKKRPVGIHSLNIFKIFNFNRKEFKRTFIFTDTSKYNLNDQIAQDRWQKLFGQSFNFAFHHKYSARFVWRWNNQISKFEIGSYVYLNGVRKWKSIYNISVGEMVHLTIKINDNIIYFLVNDELKDRYVLHKKIKNYGYTLGTYFGDSSNKYPNAPYDMKILVDKYF